MQFFEDAGHDLFMFKDCLPVISSIAFNKIRLNIGGNQYKFNQGGTPLGVMRAKKRSRKLSIQFLEMFKSTPAEGGV